MRIGIDLDDTICRTTERAQQVMKKYADELGIDVLEIINNELLQEKFMKEHLGYIYATCEIKHDVKDVLRRIRNKGNEIFVISGRKESMVKNVLQITEEWFRENEIEVDGIYLAYYGESKADVCKRVGIDLMIDDDPYNYKKITGNGGACLLFDDREKYNLRDDYVTSWKDVENYINKFRK